MPIPFTMVHLDLLCHKSYCHLHVFCILMHDSTTHRSQACRQPAFSIIPYCDTRQPAIPPLAITRRGELHMRHPWIGNPLHAMLRYSSRALLVSCPDHSSTCRQHSLITAAGPRYASSPHLGSLISRPGRLLSRPTAIIRHSFPVSRHITCCCCWCPHKTCMFAWSCLWAALRFVCWLSWWYRQMVGSGGLDLKATISSESGMQAWRGECRL
jgi:hypothetical protein